MGKAQLVPAAANKTAAALWTWPLVQSPGSSWSLHTLTAHEGWRPLRLASQGPDGVGYSLHITQERVVYPGWTAPSGG